MRQNHSLAASVLLTSASFAGYNIGSGFATGIEGQQFFAVWGARDGFAGLLLAMVVAAAVLAAVYLAGFRERDNGSRDAYAYFFGPRLGRIFNWYIYLSIILVIFTLTSGAGATIHQHLGLPEIAGTGLIGVLCIAAALAGLTKLMRILGSLGTFIVLFVLGCGVYVFLTAGNGPVEGAANAARYVAEGKILPANIGGLKDPWSSALASAGLLINSGFPWALATGALCRSRKEAVLSGIFSAVFYYGAKSIVVYLNLVDMDFIAASEVPILAVIQHHLPQLAPVYSVLILLAIFSTVSGRLFLVADRFGQGSRTRSLVISFALIVAASLIGSAVSFSLISNLLFSFNGAVGIIICAAVARRALFPKA